MTIRAIGARNRAWPLPDVVADDAVDPEEMERNRQRAEQSKRNLDWLQAHWDEVLPRVRGKYLAVAGQEAFVADTPEEAVALARAVHPGEPVFVQYVFPEPAARIYTHRW